MESIVAHPSTGPTLRFRRRWTAGLIGVCPPKAKVTRSNRVGCASFSLFSSAIWALGLRLQFCFVRSSKQFLEESRLSRGRRIMFGRFTPSSCLKIAVDPCAANERQQDSVMQSSSMVLFEFDLKRPAIVREGPTGAALDAPAPAFERVSPLQTVQPPANGITWP